MSTLSPVGLARVGGPSLPQVRRLVTEIPGPKSRALLERKAAAISRGVGIALPIAVEAAGGGVIVDADGNSLIDLGSGIAVTTVGNAAPEVAAAIAAQSAAFTHTCFMITAYEGYVALAERLNRLAPGDHDQRSALFNSGAEAVENAVKIARAYTGRSAVVVLDHAYHGRTGIPLAMTAKADPYKLGFGPFSPEVYRVPGSYPLRDGGLDGAEAARRAIAAIERLVGRASVAALVVEPIQGEGGFIVPADGFLPRMVDWAREAGAVFVADEVQTGFARTGAMFACERFSIVPDLIVTGKGIAGGMPLSAVTGRAEILDAVDPGGLGGTYGGNPVSVAAALAALDLYEHGGLIARALEVEHLLKSRLSEIAERDPRVGEVRGLGAMIAIELVDPATGHADAALTGRVAAAARAQGVVLLTAGSYGNVIRFLPPLTISDELLREGLDVVAEALAGS